MMFEIENRKEGKKSHCGVIEFSADEGMVYLPYWASLARCAVHVHCRTSG